MDHVRTIMGGGKREKPRLMEKLFRSNVGVKGRQLKTTNFDFLLKTAGGSDVDVVVGVLHGQHGEFVYKTASSVVDTTINREIARGVAVHLYQQEVKEKKIAFELAHTANVMTGSEITKATKEATSHASLIQQRINDGVKEALKN